MRRGLRRSTLVWSILGILGFLVLPWYALPDGLFGLGWPARMLTERDLAPAVLQAVKFGRPWLLADYDPVQKFRRLGCSCRASC